MATIDIVVSPVESVEWPAAALAHGAESLITTATIYFPKAAEGEQQIEPVKLDLSHPRAALYSDLLNTLTPRQVAWMEIDEETRYLQSLEIPLVAPVAAIYDEPSGDVTVRLVGAGSLRTLKRSEPQFEELRKTLFDAAVDRRARVALSERGGTREIVAVRRVRPFERPLMRPSALLFDANVVGGLTEITDAQAREAFAHLIGFTCNPLVIDASCIPFVFPDHGCAGRAHMMCERLAHIHGDVPELPNVISGKIWHHAVDLRREYLVRTPNAPDCEVPFVVHTATLIRLKGGALRVIDPAFFVDGPVDVDDWHAIQSADGRRMLTQREVYSADAPDVDVRFDPLGDQAFLDLGFARGKLLERVRGEHRPPPYCPI